MDVRVKDNPFILPNLFIMSNPVYSQNSSAFTTLYTAKSNLHGSRVERQ